MRLTTSKALKVTLAVFLVITATTIAHADDDYIPPPPVDPGAGFEGLLPGPVLPSDYIIDQSTIPYGIRQVFNSPQTSTGQSFKPSFNKIDWVSFPFQNNTQPNTIPGPGTVRVKLYSSLNTSNGTLGGLLGTTNTATIASNTTQWLLFHFPASVSVMAGNTYFLSIEQVSGYPSWVGGRLQNVYQNGTAFQYLNGDDYARGYDLNFAQGVIVPEPASMTALAVMSGIFPLLRKRRS